MPHPASPTRRSVARLKFGLSTLLATGLMLSSCAPQAAPGVVLVTPAQSAPTLTPSQLTFSGVKTTTTVPKSLKIGNSGKQSINITALTLTGTNASAFVLDAPPSLPLTIDAGQSLALGLKFSPQGRPGVLKAALVLTLDDNSTLSLALSGLSTQAEQGEGEPPLSQVVQALGYGINVGSSALILGTSATPIGDEIVAPLFHKTGTGPVTLQPVARYSPDDLLPFGSFTLQGGKPVLNQVGVIARHQEQTLNPALDSGGNSFDPGTATFGIYAGANAYSATNDYTLDTLNADAVKHAVRVYPMKDAAGQAQPGYLLAFEAGTNGDYQDYVFVMTGAEPVSSTP